MTAERMGWGVELILLPAADLATMPAQQRSRDELCLKTSSIYVPCFELAQVLNPPSLSAASFLLLLPPRIFALLFFILFLCSKPSERCLWRHLLHLISSGKRS